MPNRIPSAGTAGDAQAHCAQGLKPRRFYPEFSARLKSLLKNAFAGREIKQGLKSVRKKAE
jgi:hypothetical protein